MRDNFRIATAAECANNELRKNAKWIWLWRCNVFLWLKQRYSDDIAIDSNDQRWSDQAADAYPPIGNYLNARTIAMHIAHCQWGC